jgi:hypothetical protein
VQLWLRRKIRDCADAADQPHEKLWVPEDAKTLVHYEREIREKRTMSTRIIVTEEAGVFRLRTERGFVLGPRLYSVAPESGKVLPGLQDEFPNKLAATRAAMDWNVYLLWAWKKRSKSRERSAD